MTVMSTFAPGDMVRALWWNTVADKQGDTHAWKEATVTRVRMAQLEVFFAGRAHGESGVTISVPLYDIEWKNKSSSQTEGRRPDDVKPLLPDSGASVGSEPDSQPGSAGAVPGSAEMAGAKKRPGSAEMTAAKKRHKKGRGAASRAKKRHKSGSASVVRKPAGSARGSAGKSGRASRPSRSCTLRPASVSQGEEHCASMSSSEDEDSGVESDESSEWKPSDASGSDASEDGGSEDEEDGGSEDEEDVEESSEYDSMQSSEDEDDVEEMLD